MQLQQLPRQRGPRASCGRFRADGNHPESDRCHHPVEHGGRREERPGSGCRRSLRSDLGHSKSIANPDAINYKAVAISPAGSFLDAETLWRTGATGSDINTALTGVPLQYSQAYQLSEFFGSARQSRIALKATGKFADITATGYYEADFLSSGTTSNNNQSNSYTLRQRELWPMQSWRTGGISPAAPVGRWRRKPVRALHAERKFCRPPSTHNIPPASCGRAESFRVSKNIGKKLFMGDLSRTPRP